MNGSRLSAVIFCALLLMTTASAWSGPQLEIRKVVVAGPSWEKFTNRDGTGLYHEILNRVFGLYGIAVVRYYMPSKQANNKVAAGTVDMMTCHGEQNMPAPFILSRHPMFQNKYHAFFRKDLLQNWKGMESLQSKRVVWRIGYYDKSSFPVDFSLVEVKTGESGLGMVALGRADYYIDDINFIQTSMAHSKVTFNPDDFVIKTIGKRGYYPLLKDSPRGRAVKELFDNGMEELLRSGELEKIFAKWGFALPEYRVEK